MKNIQTRIYVGTVKLQASTVDNIAGAFLQSSRKTLHFVPPTKQNGEIIIRPTKEVVDNGSKKWQTTAVGYCLGRRPYFPQLEAFARANWKGLQQVSATSSGFFFFRFTTRFAMEDVIEGGPWLFQGQPIVLQFWEQGMSLRRQKHTQIPVWIRLRHLPMEYWTEEGLSTVASGIGTPLYTDVLLCGMVKRTQKGLTLNMSGCLNGVLIVVHWGMWQHLVRKHKKDFQSPITIFVKKQSATVNPVQPAMESAGTEATTVCKNSAPVLGKAWNPLEVGVDILRVESQFVHCRAFNKRLHTRCLITVLYGAYDLIPRRNLWSALCNLSAVISNEPWLVLGDFNAVMDDSEVYGRAADTSVSMTEFRNCIRDSGLVQLPFTGCPFTWHNCSEGPRSLWKRLDRMLANTNWMDAWPNSSYISALPSTSDHSPLILTGMDRGEEHVIFRFDNYLAHLPGFLNSVKEIWRHRIVGTAMYETVCKLKLLKDVFRQQKRLKGNLTDNVRQAKNFLDKAQVLFTTYKEDIFLDLNLFGGPSLHRSIDLEFLRPELKHTITTAEASLLVTPVTLSEVKNAFFDIDAESAPGPDGYTSAFYRNAWPVIGQTLFQAVDEFFRTGKMLKQINTTLISFDPEASFSVSLNGSIHGFFKGGRGLRQGDPMSPYLFVLVMEIWNLLLKFRIKEAADFQYHWKCKDIGLINLCFADDVLLFCKAHLPSIIVISDTLNEFAALSGRAERQQILDYLGFQEGSLPVKYLGIPLTSSRLTIADRLEQSDLVLRWPAATH
ncbi:UNVERIFIED_CONTAM: hypothetical protein Sradi_6911600 [Sesamum radiatum]|uniref:DUF4283 domain-containing protein n=1 Tax=Sesamum radiatum TaxID=300843 RepID=A0AAW2JHL1_SESRA